MPDPDFTFAVPVTVSTSTSPDPVVSTELPKVPIARTSEASAFTSRWVPVGQLIVTPTRGPCRNSPVRCRGTSTTTESRRCSTRAWATASSPGELSGVSSTVVTSVSSAVMVTWPAPARTTRVVRSGVWKVCTVPLLFVSVAWVIGPTP